jgi:hypothetical protein
MYRNIRSIIVFLILIIFAGSLHAAETAEPYIGRWALTIPGGAAGWLGVTQEDGYLDASILWGGGSVVPVDSVFMVEGDMYIVRLYKIERKNDSGEVVRTQTYPEALIARVYGDQMDLTQMRPSRDGLSSDLLYFGGKKIPPLPPKPDLFKIKYGKPIVLFVGKSLDGWELTNPNHKSGWSIEDGIMVNRPVQQEDKPHISYGNLRTVAEFEDFNLKLQVKVPPNGNSGIYLRGIYEVQVSDSYGKELDSHNMGAIYSRITPTVAAEKPADQWQSFNITLVDRHVTVELNGKRIIDNQPLLGCTGGALWSDEFRPGPIYLQGDHTAISYRNIVLTPIVK